MTTPRWVRYLIIAACLAPFLAACAPPPTPHGEISEPTERPDQDAALTTAIPVEGARTAMPALPPSLTPDPTPTSREGVADQDADLSPGMHKLVNHAVVDLASRLRMDPAEVEVVEVKAVVWPDGSLGCPQPDMAYVQVQKEGSLIRLRAGKSLYDYHSGGGREPFLCE